MGPGTVDDDESGRLIRLLLLMPMLLLLLLACVFDIYDQKPRSSPGQLFMHTCKRLSEVWIQDLKIGVCSVSPNAQTQSQKP